MKLGIIGAMEQEVETLLSLLEERNTTTHAGVAFHEGRLDGKDVFGADDILSSGESIIDVARNLKKRNANRIFAAVTLTLFTNGLELYNKAYEEGLIDGVISTNLTYRTPELQAAPWFIEADMSKYISYIIATLNHDRSLSKLLSPSDRIAALKEKYEQEQVQNGIKLV